MITNKIEKIIIEKKLERDDGGSAWFFAFSHSEVTRNTNIIT